MEKMGLFGKTEPQRTVIRTYGRGSFLGLLSPLLAAVMAAMGMHGWQEAALREMEDDAVAMAKGGYRVVSSGEYGIPAFGVVYYKVIYELDRSPQPN
jgi:hypothetical protein